MQDTKLGFLQVCSKAGTVQGFAGCLPLMAEGWGCLLASIPPAQLLVAPWSDTPARAPIPSCCPGLASSRRPLGLCSKMRHFSMSISTDLGLIWVASVYRLNPLLNNASVTAVLSSFHNDVNVFNQGALDTY